MGYFKDKAKILEGVIKRDADTGWGIGAAIVRFESFSEAEDLILKLSGKTTILGVNKQIISLKNRLIYQFN